MGDHGGRHLQRKLSLPHPMIYVYGPRFGHGERAMSGSPTVVIRGRREGQGRGWGRAVSLKGRT